MYLVVAVSLLLAAVVLISFVLLGRHHSADSVRKMPGPKTNLLFGNVLQLPRLPNGEWDKLTTHEAKPIFFAIICHHLCLIAHKQTIKWNLFVRFEFTKYEGKIKTNSKLPLQRSTQVKLLSFTNSYILSWLENTIFSFKKPIYIELFL